MDDDNQKDDTAKGDDVFDCIVIGGGPGGLQAVVYLGRYNRKALLIDRGGGRTAHAKSIENLLTHASIPGRKIIELGMAQARSFNVRIDRSTVTAVRKQQRFTVTTREAAYHAEYVIVATGIADILPPIENLHQFFSTSYFTCVDCDGYKTRGKKLAVMGDAFESVRIAFAMRRLYTDQVVLVLVSYEPPAGYAEELREEGIGLYQGTPARITGAGRMEAIELVDGTRVPCEMIMANFGFTRNDGFLKDLDLKRSANGSIIVNHVYESSLSGLFVVGPLNTGNDQVAIAMGQGAAAAIDINKRLFDF